MVQLKIQFTKECKDTEVLFSGVIFALNTVEKYTDRVLLTFFQCNFAPNNIIILHLNSGNSQSAASSEVGALRT